MFSLQLPYASSVSTLGKGTFSSWQQWEQEMLHQKLMCISLITSTTVGDNKGLLFALIW